MSTVVVPDQIINAPDNATTAVAIKRDAHGRIIGGGKGAGSLNPGGRPKRIAEIEKMLNKEHRNVEALRPLMARLRALAMGEAIPVAVQGEHGMIELQAKLVADPAFMKLYLDRVLGPVKVQEEMIDLSDAPAEVLHYLLQRLPRR